MRSAESQPEPRTGAPRSSPAPPSGASVQRRALRGLSFDEAVQRLSPVQRAEEPEQVHSAAARGTSGGGGSLPHLGAIQRSFGGHDVSGISAHTGGQASEACDSMGAQAYATGSSVAFRGAPDLHTAAHEAAHIVQQRAGVQLSGGVGQVGDSYERNADAVADRVVQGKSAEDLLGGGSGGAGAVQRAVQRESVHSLSQVKQQQQQHLMILAQIDAAIASFGKTHKVPHLVPGAKNEAGKLVRAHPDSADQVFGLVSDFLVDDQVAAMSPGSKGVILNHLKSVLADLNVEFGGQRTLTCAAQLAKAIMKKKDMRGMLVRMRGVLHDNKMAKTFDPKNLDDMAVADAGDTNLDRMNHGFGGGMAGMHHQYGAGMSDDQLGKAVFRGGKGMSPCASGSFKGSGIDAAVFSDLLGRAKAGELVMVTLEKKGGALHKMMVLGTAGGPRLWDPNDSSPSPYTLSALRSNAGESYIKAHGWVAYAKKDNPWGGRRDL